TTDSSSSSTTSPDMTTASSSSSETSGEQVAPEDAASSSSSSEGVANGQAAAIEPAPEGLTEVHIVGTKYTDSFIDWTSEFAFPGDPDVDAHLSEANAPTPTHEGLTWARTVGQHLYDTQSGDLETGQYALQSNGTYIAKPFPFVSSTSTAPEVNPAMSSSSE